MKLTEIYKEYKIHPNLQNHMIWVASLAKVLLDNWNVDDEKPNEKSLIEACLFHDSAKLIKFKYFDNDTSHWEKIKNEYIEKYGDNEHNATVKICELVGINSDAIQLLNDKNVSPFIERARKINKSSDFGLKLLAYCDSRIAPNGITTLEGRYRELMTRDDTKSEDKESMNLFLDTERQIQDRVSATLNDITQKDLDEYKDYFENYEI